MCDCHIATTRYWRKYQHIKEMLEKYMKEARIKTVEEAIERLLMNRQELKTARNEKIKSLKEKMREQCNG